MSEATISGSGDGGLTEIWPGLYLLSSGQTAPCWLYFLTTVTPASPPASVDEIWKASDPSSAGTAKYYGWFLFVPEPITEQDAAWFDRRQPNDPVPVSLLQWRQGESGMRHDAPPVSVLVAQWLSPGQFSVYTAASFRFGGFALIISGQVTPNIAFDPSGTGRFLVATAASAVQIIQITYDGTPQRVFVPPNGWSIAIPLDGPENGSLIFNMVLDIAALSQRFGCCLRYSHGDEAAPVTLIYPVFPPGVIAQYKLIALDAKLNPALPFRADCTHLGLDLSGAIWPVYSQNAASIRTPWLVTPQGGVLMLTVQADAGASPEHTPPPGFAFCQGRVGAASPGDTLAPYLAPSGTFILTTAESPAPPGVTCRLMPGLFANEFLDLRAGDRLVFESNRPAWAPGFSGNGSPAASPSGGSPSSSTTPTLTDYATTAWVRVVADGDEPRPYFTQPSTSSYFSMAAGDLFPMVVDAKLGDVAAEGAFPLVLYGGLDSADPMLAAFEGAVFANARHEALARSPDGPVFIPYRGVRAPGPHGFRAALLAPPPTPMTATTPQGLVVELNEDGTWRNLLLARSPDDPDRVLAFDAVGSPGLMDPGLARQLLLDQLFLVVNTLDPYILSGFRNEINLGGFAFRLDVSPGPTILIFKFNNTIPLETLVTSPSLWAGKDVFVDDVAATADAIEAALETARKDPPGGPFTAFNKLVTDPAWTGIVALNIDIDGNAIPLDLQILLGGIDGTLRAHHLGIEITRKQPGASPGSDTVGQSSLFAVIDYVAPPVASPAPPPTDAIGYELERLIVVFLNSKVTVFDVAVGLTINRLFGRPLLLSGGSQQPGLPANTMSIRGQYQSNGSVGTVSFVTDTPFDCEFQLPAPGASQVLNRVTFTGASLIPVSATPLGGPGGNHIVADFRMVVEMWFNESPFPGRDGLDLFCYGVTDVGGLDFSDLTIRLDFNLGPDGSMVPGSRKITFEPDVLQVSATHGGAAIRPGSLLHSLPLRISGFAYAADGLTASATGAAVVHVQQLESSTPTAGSPQVPHASPSTDEQQSPYTTSTPIYALEYDLSLGSLGSLSNLHGGISAKLLLAWGPSPLIPDDDAAAVLVQSPQLGGGYGSFDLEGILKVVFGDANLLRVELDRGRAVYAILFNNIALSVLGYTFPPGILIDFMLFAGSPAAGQATNADNIAWFLSAQQEKAA